MSLRKKSLKEKMEFKKQRKYRFKQKFKRENVGLAKKMFDKLH